MGQALWRKRAKYTYTLVAVAVMLTVGCTSERRPGLNAASTTPSSATDTTGALVGNRAAAPTQQSAPGLQLYAGSFEVSVNGNRLTISGDDWNTITDSSTVSHNVGVTLDPDFHADTTTRNRFQYMADRIIAFAPGSFDPVGIVAEPVGANFVSIVALINPTGDTYQLSGFQETVTESPPDTTVAAATFYSAPGTALVLPGKDIYFVRLTLPLRASPPSSAKSTAYSFHWDRLYDCGTKPC